MEFRKLVNGRYLIVNSNNIIVSEEEKLKLEKRELVLEDINSSDCQKKTTKKIKKIDKELENVQSDVVEETTTATE